MRLIVRSRAFTLIYLLDKSKIPSFYVLYIIDKNGVQDCHVLFGAPSASFLSPFLRLSKRALIEKGGSKKKRTGGYSKKRGFSISCFPRNSSVESINVLPYYSLCALS